MCSRRATVYFNCCADINLLYPRCDWILCDGDMMCAQDGCEYCTGVLCRSRILRENCERDVKFILLHTAATLAGRRVITCTVMMREDDNYQ